MRLIVLALALTAAPAMGQQAPAPTTAPTPRTVPITQPPTATIMAEPVAVMIGACDANGDAEVTRAELSACVARSFASIDTAKAGAIGYIAFADWAERWLGDRNALPSPFETDTSGDNKISLAEMQVQFDKTFTRLDRDKDGVLKRSELLTLDGPRGGGFGRGPDGGPGGGRGRGGRGRPGPAEQQ